MRLIDSDWILDYQRVSAYETVADVLNAVRKAPAIALPPNDPLTLEGLREMDGEPVWVQHLKKPELSAWALYYYDPRRQAGAVYSMSFEAVDRDYDDINCEKVWLAYRSRPEEF